LRARRQNSGFFKSGTDKITTNPAAFGATDSQATNGVLAAS